MDQRLLKHRDVLIYTVRQAILAVSLTNIIVIPTALLAYGRSFDQSVNVGFVFWLSVVTGSLAAAGLTLALSWQSAKLFNELVDARAELYQLSRTDPLTGLLNRRGFIEKVAEMFADTGMRESRVSILMCDIDRFKSINDRFGHDTGDSVLQRVATIIREMDPEGITSRYGGEEFVVMLPNTAAAEARQIAERLRLACALQLISTPSSAVTITISIGVATSQDGKLPSLMADADKALYAAKSTGRNRVVVADQKVA